MPSAQKLTTEKSIGPDDLPDAPKVHLDFVPSEAKDVKAAVQRASAVRQPNPFDDIILRSYQEHQPYEFPFPHQVGGDLAEEKANLYALLRAAAQFHGLGLDVRILHDTSDDDRRVWFSARPKKVIKRNALR